MLTSAVALVSAQVLLPAVGVTPLTIRSGSMTPALRTGDVVLSRATSPARLQIGQLVTFSDPNRGGDLVTHRVVAVAEMPDSGARGGADAGAGTAEQVLVETKGDANQVSEHWSAPSDGQVGVVVFRIPVLGWLLRALAEGWVRLALIASILGWPAATQLRRIWRPS